MTLKEILVDMPEEDKDCINCEYWPEDGSKWRELTCEGRECLNWSEDFEDNYFMPDESYLKSNYGDCENCKHYNTAAVCKICSRNCDDEWELNLKDEMLIGNTAKKVIVGGGHEGVATWFECSECGTAVNPEDNYCRNCGRKFANE